MMKRLTRNDMFELLNICEDRRESGKDTIFTTTDDGIKITVRPEEYSGVELVMYVPSNQDVHVSTYDGGSIHYLELIDLTVEQAKEILTCETLWDVDDTYFENIEKMIENWEAA